MLTRVALAVRRSAPYSAAILLTYVLSAAVGAAAVHAGNRAALARRDAMVARALAHDRSSRDYGAGHRLRAAAEDAAANFGLAALPQAALGLTVALPFATVAWQGWDGGLVSVDARHASRLRTARGAAYYVGVLLLQFLAFSLPIGAGVRCGVALYRANRDVGWHLAGYRVDRSALFDLGCVVASSLPLFLVASAVEFLSPWNA